MCTVLILSRVHPDYPVVIAANRDELYAREAKSAQVIMRDPLAVGGLDVQAGGTWMGVTAAGVLVALTNHRPTIPVRRAPRSRGEIVMRALATRTPDAIRDYVQRLDPADYDSFNLLFGDASGLSVAYGRREPPSIEIEPVPDGVHVLPSDRLDCPDLPRVARAIQLATPVSRDSWDELRRGLIAALADHTLGHPLHSVCIHTEQYGTRSAMLVALEPRGVAHCEFADGPLCQNEPFDVRHLLSP